MSNTVLVALFGFWSDTQLWVAPVSDDTMVLYWIAAIAALVYDLVKLSK